MTDASGSKESRKPLVLVLSEDRLALGSVMGALAAVVGSALTWASVPVGFTTLTVQGLEANGKVTIVLGVVALAFVLASLRVRGRDLPIAAAIVGFGCAGVALAYLRDVNAASAQVIARLLQTQTQLDPAAVADRFAAHPGPGIWIVVAGGALAGAASLARLARDRGAPVA